MKRVGQVIRVRPESIVPYEQLHAAVWPGVLDALHAANVHNYSIFRHGDLLFSYFEYTGDDYARDMARIAADTVTQEWWRLTEAMQEPLTDAGSGGPWLTLPEVFHTD